MKRETHDLIEAVADAISLEVIGKSDWERMSGPEARIARRIGEYLEDENLVGLQTFLERSETA